ncbi:MAG: hypothetical protein WCS52_17070 [bacterium]
MSIALFIVIGLSFLGMLVAALWNLGHRRWGNGVANLLAVPLCGIVGFFAVGFIVFASMFGPSEDGFGKDIVIPPDMKLEIPLGPQAITNRPASDTEGMALIDSFSTNHADHGSNDISVDIPVLDEFAGQNRALLLRHLASSAKWFVTKERGKIYAYRRCVINGRWQNSLNGFYSASTFDMWGNQRFQFRIIIGPDGPVMSHPWRAKATVANISNRVIRVVAAEDKRFSQGIESYLVLGSKGAALEIFEQSQSHDRPFTPLTLQQIDRELKAVVSSPVAQQRGFDPSLMPPESVKSGDSEIHIENGMQGGIYFVHAYLNPGEPGFAYLKVFEATRNTPLSASRLPERSTEYVGWSETPGEQFLYSSEITVYEGDWGVYYPARFELWFVPDSGKPERKLIEKIFKIEGWQR